MSIFKRIFGKRVAQAPKHLVPRALSGQAPVDNPELSAAMVRVANNPTNEAERSLISQLQDARYLVFLNTDGTSVPPGQEFTQNSPEVSDRFSLGSCVGPDGTTYLPLFTDWPTMRAWAEHHGRNGQTVSAFVFSAIEAWSFLLSQPCIDGGIVFSSETSVPLSRPLVQRLLNESVVIDEKAHAWSPSSRTEQHQRNTDRNRSSEWNNN